MKAPGATKAPPKEGQSSTNLQYTNSQPKKWQPPEKHACTQLVGIGQCGEIKDMSAMIPRLTFMTTTERFKRQKFHSWSIFPHDLLQTFVPPSLFFN